MQEIEWLCRWSPTLGALESTAEEIWGTINYKDRQLDDGYDKDPLVSFGLYGFPDFYHLWRWSGRKCILWAGSDIRHFCNGYWLDKEGLIRLDPFPLARWINLNCESYVENHVEQEALCRMGIHSKVVPSFLGNVDDFPLSYKPEKKIRLYTSVSGDDFKVYGWDKIPQLAKDNPDVEFHLYGHSHIPEFFLNTISSPNVRFHWRVPKEQMNTETKEMTGALRLTEFDGFSEIIAKSLLWGQWPVSLIEYPHVIPLRDIWVLRNCINANIEGREWLLSVVNKYPWNKNI